MQRPTLWLMLVVLLLGVLFLREPRLEQSISLAVISLWTIWLPGCLPLGAVWLLVIISIITPRGKRAKKPNVIAVAPAIP